LPALTVYATPPAIRTSLHLQPGFALIVRADRRIDTVAIGDPRMVAAAPVRRGPDVFDVVLQPLVDTGTTNMVLWLGEITTVWNLKIGSGPRTADVVFVVTQARTAQPAAPSPATTHSPRGAAAASATTPAPRNTAGPTPATPPATTPPAPAGPPAASSAPSSPGAPSSAGTTSSPGTLTAGPALELRQTVGAIKAVFHAVRTRSGIVLRYEITNGGATDLLIKPGTILVRADGRPVAYGMARDSVDLGRPDVVPRGATETGMIDIARPGARQVELVLSLLPVPLAAPPPSPPASSAQTGTGAPAARAGSAPSVPVPIVLQATFSGLDRLPVTPAP
jgi:hypothetical protein